MCHQCGENSSMRSKTLRTCSERKRIIDYLYCRLPKEQYEYCKSSILKGTEDNNKLLKIKDPHDLMKEVINELKNKDPNFDPALEKKFLEGFGSRSKN